jgi:hypothetical protein
VGYATLADLNKAGEQISAFGDDEKQAIIEEADVVSMAYSRFKDAQLVMHSNPKAYKAAKDELNNRLSVLNDKLNKYLAVTYLGPTASKKVYDTWLASHQPFHWLAEFYTTIAQGGFDVIIGNPPYVEISDVIKQYKIRGLSLVETGNLYSVCLERFISFMKEKGRYGVIVPISSVSTPRMLPLMKLMTQAFAPLYVSNFAVRPGKLFIGTDMNLNIILGEKQKPRIAAEIRSTRYNRWQEEYRPYLFENLSYTTTCMQNGSSSIPKIGSAEENVLMQKLAKHASLARYQLPASNADIVYYHSGGRYFRKCIREKLSNEYKELVVEKGMGDAVICLLSSSLYYWFWIAISDCYHVTKRDINVLPVPDSLVKDAFFRQLADLLILDLNKHAKTQIRNRADGSQRNEVNFQVGKSKLIIDQIDRALAKHYGFAKEELDFIINYDIKYRGDGADE